MTGFTLTAQHDRFRNPLIAARQQQSLAQMEAARRLGKPQSFVSKYKQGERRLDVIEFLFVAEAIGVDPDELISQCSDRIERSCLWGEAPKAIHRASE